MNILARTRDRLLGRGDHAITVPVFDGALKPNQHLQTAEVVIDDLVDPNDLATDDIGLLLASGSTVVRIAANGAQSEVLRATGRVTALATIEGGLAVAIDGREVRVFGGRHDGFRVCDVAGKPLHCVNALAVRGDVLLLCDGSRNRAPDEWRHDLMELGRSGRVCEIDLSKGLAREIATGLGYAFGVFANDDEVWISESWRHRVRMSGEVGRKVLSELPGYPSRMAPAMGGGAWLTVFACRTQLVEFVLREPAYRKRMIATIEPDLWISPQIASDLHLQEPLQHARVKTLGMIKPWAPPRSYGLVIRLGVDGSPQYSLHSRVDGNHHGVVACAQLGDWLYVLSKGARRLLRLPIPQIEQELGR
ncbi:hypothetical protein [Sphingobium sp.]|uniref:hypothetical protein n=1 Tax=Sphingobium sp. TaxID=1912891 RepID=UPI0028BF2ED1|nr:hypothetical protein [Sphingobium sp.]